jgi:pyruvate kinase
MTENHAIARPKGNPEVAAPVREPGGAALKALYRKVAALRQAVVRDGAATLALWEDALDRSEFRPAAENLAHYLALRRRDLSALQPALAAYGLSSLGRSEGRVLVALDTLLATLGRLAAMNAPPYPGAARMAEGRAALAREQVRFFGRHANGSQTRIMATLPTEAGDDRAFVRRLVSAGMACARINCAHDDPAIWVRMITNVRSAARAAKRDCSILMDIAGPKCRIETVYVSGNGRLRHGDRIALVRHLKDAELGDTAIVTLSIPTFLGAIAPGAEVWFDDGKIGARVVEKHGNRAVLDIFRVRIKGVRLGSDKGINFPGTEVKLDALGESDVETLDFIAQHADIVGFSFVQRPSDLHALDRELAKRRPGKPPQPVVLKIETRLGVENLPQLIVTAAATRPVAVMIARGDLAVDLGFARLSEIQEELLWLCDAAHVPVVWATQVLDNLVSDGSPSRAEATDAAMSQRAECVMLNKGPFLAEGVSFLADILSRMDRHQNKKFARFGALHSWKRLEIEG